MSVRQIKMILWWCCGVLICSSLAVVGFAFFWPYDGEMTEDSRSEHPSISSVEKLPDTWPKLSTFAPLWTLDLRRPLYDVSPQSSEQPSSPRLPQVLGLRLTGTVIEPNHSIAMFITREGKVALRSVGQKVEQAQILEIMSDRVSVEHAGRQIDLVLERKHPRQ